MSFHDEENQDFDPEYADEVSAKLIRLVMQRQPAEPNRARVYEALFALATATGVALEATGKDADRMREWFEGLVTLKIAEAAKLRARSKN